MNELKRILIAIFLAITLVVVVVYATTETNNPTACTSGGWLLCGKAGLDDGITTNSTVNGTANDTGVWRNYHFNSGNISNTTNVTNMTVIVDFWSIFSNPVKPAKAKVRVSWNAGSTWSAPQYIGPVPSETRYFLDFTSATPWNLDKVSDANFRVEVTCYLEYPSAPDTGSCYMDWLGGSIVY